MNFILLTAGIMAVSILVIDRLCHFFHIGLKRSSLLLCAIMAFVINGAVILCSPFLDRAHYLRLAGLVILAAGAVTLFNEHLLRRDAAQAQATAAPAATAANTSPVAAVNEPAKTETAPVSEAKAAPAVEEPQPAPTTAQPAEGVEAPAVPVVQPATAKQAAPKAPVPVALPQPTDAVRAQVAAARNLDDLLDLAYAEAEAGNVIYIYQQAIAHYEDDPYLPFLVIELANTYKDNAAYDQAIAAYETALTKKHIADNAAVVTKFQDTLRYLHSVQIILAKHDATATRFRDIPEPLMQEIETVFQQDGAQKS
jgi:tetratricopeptide (TPR) repeat protein